MVVLELRYPVTRGRAWTATGAAGAQPTCAYVLKNEYADFLGTDDARLVSEHRYDSSEYLARQHQPLDTNFSGTTYDTITWQAARHYRA